MFVNGGYQVFNGGGGYIPSRAFGWSQGIYRDDWSLGYGSDSYRNERYISEQTGGYQKGQDFYNGDGGLIVTRNGKQGQWIDYYVNGIVDAEHYIDSEFREYNAQNGGNIYQEISNTFNETKLDYIGAENVGANAMFNMIGNYSVKQVDGKYYFMASAAGTTPAKSQGDVAFQGSAELLVNGKQVNITPFTYNDGYNVSFPDGFSNLGALSFQLPTSGTVMINLKFSYHIVFGSAGQRHSSTMTIPVYIRTVGLPKN
ncbi:hypothetical protein C900_00222 [Fulvivirga imtechensis AK7]|uniref:Uncharacterized protein n=1 Tax=Fulvivirga imtechensis AK7 TaxID=1237149 RepID=L8JMH9_9BACT|nr:hypothetical protein [Fulvivirga imtechensis]ELR68597.1 hypothetical protein C900_00222 [Fulvivirga imtechensis AK7]